MSENAENNDITATRGYPMPHPDNWMRFDVPRIREAFNKVDDDVHDLRLKHLLGDDNDGSSQSGAGIWWNT